MAAPPVIDGPGLYRTARRGAVKVVQGADQTWWSILPGQGFVCWWPSGTCMYMTDRDAGYDIVGHVRPALEYIHSYRRAACQ